jgi:hypothetical protein
MKNLLMLVIIALLLFTGYLGFITFLSAGTSGDPAIMRYFIPLGIAFIAEIIGLSIGSTYETDSGTKMLVIGLVIPIVALMFAYSENQSDVKKYKDYKTAQEATCTVTQIQQYRYKVCAGGFTPLDVCDAGYGTPECINATKVWDQNH